MSKRYFRYESESMLGVGVAWSEFRGEHAIRQVEHYGDRWFCSVRDWYPEIGIALGEGRLSELDLSTSVDIEPSEFESVWAIALDHVEPPVRSRYAVGDATAPDADRAIIAHVCNDLGRWGKGFALALGQRFPRAAAAFREWHAGKGDEFALGRVQFVEISDRLVIANMVAQHGIMTARDKSPKIRYPALDQCLQRVAEEALVERRSVHMPRIGSGLAGGLWPIIEALIHSRLVRRGVHVTIYDLTGRGAAPPPHSAIQ